MIQLAKFTIVLLMSIVVIITIPLFIIQAVTNFLLDSANCNMELFGRWYAALENKYAKN